MQAAELISKNTPTLKTSDTGEDALAIMELYRVSHLPIVNNILFLGLLSDTDIYELKDPKQPIGNHTLKLYKPYVFPNQHIFEVVEHAAKYDLTTIPVVNEDLEYTGLIMLRILVKKIAELFITNGPGGIMVLECIEKNYSLVDVARIIEENGARILSFYVRRLPNSPFVQITTKINQEDLTSIIKSFERYNYNVRVWYMNESMLDQVIQERMDSLLTFLNI